MSRKIHMTRQEAKREFAESIVLVINPRDIPAIRQEWCVFLDNLQKNGKITEAQASEWQNPVLQKKDR